MLPPFLNAQVELFAAVKSLVFKSGVEVLFGPRLAAGVPGGAQKLQDTFFVFEEAFEVRRLVSPGSLCSFC